MFNSSQPFISICIPTYNRAIFLKECLNSITLQLIDTKLKDIVEIVISDNNSQDNTANLIKKYQKKYKNIRYYKNNKNIGPTKNAIRAASYGKGKYIWFFSDDDQQYQDALLTAIQKINIYKPQIMLCNVGLYTKDVQRLLEDNLLTIEKDYYIKTKKELFSFLETKFFLAIDWYTTFISNVIIERKVLTDNQKEIEKMDGKKYVFPHTAFIFYNTYDYKIYITAKTLIKYRTENLSFEPIGSKNDLEFLTHLYKVFFTHDLHIYKINRKNISIKFTILLILKYLSRCIRLILKRLIHFDISRILIRLYYGKYPLKLEYNRDEAKYNR